MATARKTKKKPVIVKESDSTYFLKLVVFLLLGSFWIKITFGGVGQIPLPIGFILGLFYASHDHFQLDRKIEYALLLVAMFIGFWAPIGLYISL